MPLQTHISFPSFSLTSKALHESAFKKLKMEIDRKNMINKEMVIDICMLVLLTIVPILLALVI
jgi:hypothetical protein